LHCHSRLKFVFALVLCQDSRRYPTKHRGNVMKEIIFLALSVLISWDCFAADPVKTKVVVGPNNSTGKVLYNALSNFYDDPFAFREKIEVLDMTVTKRVSNPDDVDGYAYRFTIETDPKNLTVGTDELEIRGTNAMRILKGMWLMAIDYPANYRTRRTRDFGYFKITDLYSYAVICEKKDAEQVSCKIGLDSTKVRRTK
jgi:hypothetical protein